MSPPHLPRQSLQHASITTTPTLPKPASFALSASSLLVANRPFFVDVPPNVVLTPGSSPSSTFLGFIASRPASHHTVPLGRLLDIRFMSIFRFKVWWTTHWIGSRGRDLEYETQFLLLDRSSDRPYVLILPIIEAQFRASLQPGEDDYVDVCAESGSTKVVRAGFREIVFVKCGWDPYGLVREGVEEVGAHMGTFKCMNGKSPPLVVDKFGWCTWDAFYLKVHPRGVLEGVKSLKEGGCPPGFVLVDDGWQSICHDEDDPSHGQEGMNRTSAGEQMPCRLIRFEENYKFRDFEGKHGRGMAAFTRDLKEEFPTVEHIYVWHALCGYWGGLRPGVKGLPEARIVQPKLTPGLEKTMEDLAVDKIVNNGVGLVPPERASEMYEGLHGYLASVGIDGVKIDVIHLLEMLCEDYGGRVELAKAYYKALTDSVCHHFGGNGVIASMEQCNDFMLLGTEAISLGRVGDDFWCTDPSGDPHGTYWLQGCHMVHCAYNSLWMGNFIHPDWDMFQSTHPCAEFHAASRAISGGPVYMSDSVGQHNFDLLRSLALPNGTILRCQHYALPTLDCLFSNPLHDGVTMLKIWNLNKFTGVLGAFNCQGGGWCRETRRNKSAVEFSDRVKTTARPSDIEWKSGKHLIDIEGVESFAVYRFRGVKLEVMKLSESTEIELGPFNFELLTVSPIHTLSNGVKFAPIGLINMLNTGGAIQSLDFKEVHEGNSIVWVGIKGAGKFKAFSSTKPASCKINEKDVMFLYLNNAIFVEIPWPGKLGVSMVEIMY